jgi:CO/xanthine dehydrogenase FAD-binding subunit
MNQFQLVRANNLSHLLEFLAEHPQARVVAGATDFIPYVQSGRWKPDLAIEITRVEELHFLRVKEEKLEIGPLITFRELAESDLIRKTLPALQEAAASVGDPQIRTRATLGGNLGTASPAADSVPPLMVLEAELTLISQTRERQLPVTEFFLAPGKNALRPGEIVTSITCHIPTPGSGMGFMKLGLRQAMAVAVVNAAALFVLKDKHIHECRLALGAVAPTPIRCRQAEEYLTGKLADEVNLEFAASFVRKAIKPIDDVRSSAGYRDLASTIVARRVMELAIKRAREVQYA